MPTPSCKIAAFLGLLIFTVQVGAQSIYSQAPPDSNTARTSDFAFSFVNQQAQSFILAADASVQAVIAWGHYSSGLPSDNFTIRFYQDVGSSPATTPFAEITSVTVTREFSGLNFSLSNEPIYKYSINLGTPVSLLSSTTYYFSIVNNTSDAEHWNWTGFSGGNNQRWNRLGDANAWGASVGPPNLAFELYDAQIPTPSLATPVPTISFYGLILTVISLLVVASKVKPRYR